MKKPVLLFAMLVSVPAGMASSQSAPGIDPARLSAHIRVLASDAFEGRAPGTAGEQRTIAYLTEQFRAAGARPGGENGGWTQAVRMNRYTLQGTPSVRIAGAREGCRFEPGESMLLWSRNPSGRVALADAPLVFAGHGVVAPEAGWDDYGGADLTGAVVVLLANDPDHREASGPFGGRAMSYYGRFTTKAEAAARRGAAAVILVHDPDAADTSWDVYRAAYSAPSNGLADGADSRLAFGSWLNLDRSRQLFACAGLDLGEQQAAARTRGFRARPLPGITISVSAGVRVETTVTHNVIAILPGRRRRDEYFLYTAHWDHMGIARPDSSDDAIYNGALDNAGGVAGLLELARVFAAGPRPDRSIVFIATTLEESGLLGAEYYASHPLYPLERTAGGINMDAVNLFGPTGTMEVTGLGKTDLEDYLRDELTATGRRMQDDPNSVVGFYYRSDHFPFARRGVPFLFAGSGWDIAAERAPNRREPQVGTRFHQPSDEWEESLDFAAAARDMRLYHRIGLRLANSRAWPGWRPGAEFAAIRAASDSARRR
jgi:Zn-dependent M28 family amino/carboxypeptidase